MDIFNTLRFLYPLHIIFMVAWFAGIFFLGRLLIYTRDAKDKNEDQIIALTDLGMRRVWNIIVVPALVVTVTVGLIMAYSINAFSMPWFHLKMLLVLLFIAYCYYLNNLRLDAKAGRDLPSSKQLRLLNEVPFIILILIVFLVYLK